MKYTLLLLTGGTLLFVACRQAKDECLYDKITLQNTSDKTLYARFSFIYNEADWVDSSVAYTTDPKTYGNATYGDPEFLRVRPGEMNTEIIKQDNACPETYFSSTDTFQGISVILFDSSEIYPLSWDTVRAKRMYLKKYMLGFKEISNAGWKVTYP